MDIRSSTLSLIFAPILALLAAAAPAALSAQAVQSRTLSYKNDFISSPDGLIEYSIFAVATKLKKVKIGTFVVTPVPDTNDPWDPPTPQFEIIEVEHHIDLYKVCDHNWYSPRGLFPPRQITKQEALDRGAPESAVNNALNTPNAVSVVFYEASHVYNDPSLPNFPTDNAHRAKGRVILNATLPSHPGNRWWLKAASAIGEWKALPLDLAPGKHQITITDIEAGNTLVSLIAMDANGGRTTYFQEGYALVRKDGASGMPGGDATATIDMEFTGSTAANRYRLGYLGASNNSQSDRANLPLKEGQEAMVRVRVIDAWGNGGSPGEDHTVVIVWRNAMWASGSKTFTSRASGRHVDSGLLFKANEINTGRNETIGLGPKIPPEYVQPPYIDLTALLYNANELVDMKSVRIDVAEKRKININGYYFQFGQENVWEHASNNSYMQNLLRFTNETFSYSDVEYIYREKVMLAVDPVSLAGVLGTLNSMHGNSSTDRDAAVETLYMGLINIQDPNNAGGVAIAGVRGFVVSVRVGDDFISTTTPHEMGHCFNLKHAPSPGAIELDTAFPYGGAGMSGGWGYTRLTDVFYGEDDHVVRKMGPNGLQYNAHYDIMSYSTPKTKFSDYFVSKLRPHIRHPPISRPEPQLADITNLTLYPGTNTWVFGPEAAKAMGALDADSEMHVRDWLDERTNANGANGESPFYMGDAVQALIAGAGSEKPPSIIFTVIPKFNDPVIVD
jgi:hypothetical protein